MYSLDEAKEILGDLQKYYYWMYYGGEVETIREQFSNNKIIHRDRTIHTRITEDNKIEFSDKDADTKGIFSVKIELAETLGEQTLVNLHYYVKLDNHDDLLPEEAEFYHSLESLAIKIVQGQVVSSFLVNLSPDTASAIAATLFHNQDIPL